MFDTCSDIHNLFLFIVYSIYLSFFLLVLSFHFNQNVQIIFFTLVVLLTNDYYVRFFLYQCIISNSSFH